MILTFCDDDFNKYTVAVESMIREFKNFDFAIDNRFIINILINELKNKFKKTIFRVIIIDFLFFFDNVVIMFHEQNRVIKRNVVFSAFRAQFNKSVESTNKNKNKNKTKKQQKKTKNSKNILTLKTKNILLLNVF